MTTTAADPTALLVFGGGWLGEAAAREAIRRGGRAIATSRDADRRAILEDELKSEQARLAGLRAEYNNGMPERRGDERNYAKYQERMATLRDSASEGAADHWEQALAAWAQARLAQGDADLHAQARAALHSLLQLYPSMLRQPLPFLPDAG